jgi:hypothetical protein
VVPITVAGCVVIGERAPLPGDSTSAARGGANPVEFGEGASAPQPGNLPRDFAQRIPREPGRAHGGEQHVGWMLLLLRLGDGGPIGRDHGANATEWQC